MTATAEASAGKYRFYDAFSVSAIYQPLTMGLPAHVYMLRYLLIPQCTYIAIATMCTTGYTLTLPPTREPTFASSIPDSYLSGATIGDAELTPVSCGGKLLWIGNATCIIELNGIRFMTDPNFLHQGKGPRILKSPNNVR